MDLSPKQIVGKLDKHIIGQDEAKKAVAIALRNRYRRAQLPPEVREEITPKNIIMKGPTGVGKTEIARRLAKLVKAPFVKVEATKYTEVGYVGKDVEGMIRDLAECAYRLVKAEKEEEVRAKATAFAEKRIVRALAEAKKEEKGDLAKEVFEANLLDGLRKGQYDNFTIEIEVIDAPQQMEVVPGGAAISIGSIFGDMFQNKKKKRRLPVKEAMQIVLEEESDKLVDEDAIRKKPFAVRKTTASSLLTKSIKSQARAIEMVLTFLAKGCKEIYSPSSRALPSLPSTDLSRRTLSCLLRQVRSTWRLSRI